MASYDGMKSDDNHQFLDKLKESYMQVMQTDLAELNVVFLGQKADVLMEISNAQREISKLIL